MVNTFVTFRIKNPQQHKKVYTKTFLNLDKVRLRKQCVETIQILNILEHLYIIANYYGWNIIKPTNPELESKLKPKKLAKLYKERTEWVKTTRKKYLALKTRLVLLKNKVYEVSKDLMPFKIGKDDRLVENNDGSITVWFKTLPKPFKIFTESIKEKQEHIYLMYNSTNKQKFKYNDSDNALSLGYDLSAGGRMKRIPVIFSDRNDYLIAEKGDISYTLGFSQHAIIRMWIGYEESLKMYLNECIDTYCSLKTKNGDNCTMNIPKRNIDYSKLLHPWWITHTDIVINSHRASLLRKEINRKEPKFYILRKEFMEEIPVEWHMSGYVWADNLSEKQMSDILSGMKISASDITYDMNETQINLDILKYSDRVYSIDEDGYTLLNFKTK